MMGHTNTEGRFVPNTHVDMTDVPAPLYGGFDRVAKAADSAMWDVVERDIYVSPAMQAVIDDSEGCAS